MRCVLTNEVLHAAYPFILQQDGQLVDLDLTKEYVLFNKCVLCNDIANLHHDRLRQTSFPYLLQILRNPQPTLISLSPHSIQDDNAGGYLYLFDNKTTNYLEDNIPWAAKRMNIKLVLYNSSKNTYKLKNHKEDVGECVMRRQTWSSVSDVVWRRSEYKLMNKMVFFFLLFKNFIKYFIFYALYFNNYSILQSFDIYQFIFPKSIYK
jgi:hypothetical protein